MLEELNGYAITLRYYIYVFQWITFEVQLFTLVLILLFVFRNIVRFYVFVAIILLFISGVAIIFGNESLSRNLAELAFIFFVICAIVLFNYDKKNGNV